MVVTCEIEFDNNPHGTYFGGQVMTGRVTIKSDKMKLVKGERLSFCDCNYLQKFCDIWSMSHTYLIGASTFKCI